MMTVAEINAMPAHAFEMAFRDVAEHSPWVAVQVAMARPFASRDAMVHAFTDTVMAAPRESQLALIRAHPDLATRAKLTEDSSREQAGAGLDSLTAEEFASFTRLNEKYKLKFGFPFIIAVKGAGKKQILAGFSKRVENPPEREFATAIAQICRILRFRIEGRVSP